MVRKLIIYLFLSGFLSACGLVSTRSLRHGMHMSWEYQQRGNFSSNGEQIYLTAANESGERIDYRGGPATSGMMMSGFLACADCHGVGGRGGEFAFHMQVIDAPDIRYSALSGEAEEHYEGEDDHHAEAHTEYSLEDFRNAVVVGQHPDGKPLDREMPRWDINDQDLADLFEYIKSLP